MKLILVRHGETKDNKNKICQGWLPGSLSEQGILQSQKLAQRFAQEQIDFFYCSDLKRAKDTLAPLIEFHFDVPVKYTFLLRENSWGDYEGKLSKLKKQAIEESEDGMLYCNVRGIENGLEALTRGVKCIDRICKKHNEENSTIFLMTHNNLLSLILSFYDCDLQTHQDDSLYNPKKKYASRNTGVAEFELVENKLKLNYFNCTKHLD